MKVDFDGVQAFVAVADLGGFSRAARELHLTQTALTRRVQKLEAYLGLKLLNRTTRRVELSTVGREFLPQARAIVQDMTGAVERLKDLSRHGRGQLTLACIPSMSTHVLPGLIRAYAASHPDNGLRLIDVWRMPAIRQPEQFDVGGRFGDALGGVRGLRAGGAEWQQGCCRQHGPPCRRTMPTSIVMMVVVVMFVVVRMPAVVWHRRFVRSRSWDISACSRRAASRSR